MTQECNAIVSSYSFDRGIKLVLNHLEEFGTNKKGLGFVTHQICPSTSSKIIHNG